MVNSKLLAVCTAGLLFAATGCNDGGGTTPVSDVQTDTQPDAQPDGGDVSPPDGTDNDTDQPDGDAGPGDVEPDVDLCGNKECGTAPDGTVCGTCDAGEICTAAGQCEAPKNPNGAWCGPTADCPFLVTDPVTGEQTANTDCQHDQCQSSFCLAAGAAGVFINVPACSRPCDIAKDDNADGIEDEDTPFSDCDNFQDGPGGTNWRCVNFAPPAQGQTLSYCVPGTTFDECNSNADCAEGEGCSLTTIGGNLGERCLTKIQAGDWGAVHKQTQSCNESDPFEGEGLAYCEQGWCFGLGCIDYCSGPEACDTTQVIPDSGCGSDGKCLKNPTKDCTADIDCSVWECGEPRQIFSNVPEYQAQLCWPKSCQLDADCGEGFYCRYNWNGGYDETTGLPVWENICLAQVEDGAELGEACDQDPDDNIPGATCKNEDLCVGGYCSTLCLTDGDCAADQKCTVVEFSIDENEDDILEGVLPLEWCTTYKGSAAACWSAADCTTDGETCDLYSKHNDDTENPTAVEDAPYVAAGACVPEQGTGEVGANCLSAADCKSGFCLNADQATNTPGFCTEICKTHTECPDVDAGDGTTLKGVCTPLLLSYGGDINDPYGNIFVPLCQFTSAQGGDCSADFTCPAGEACSPFAITFGADYPSTTDYICLGNDNGDGGPAVDKTLGQECDPTAEDAEGNPIAQCVSGLCFEGVEETKGYCSDLCDPNAGTDPCTAADPEMACLEVITRPRKGGYADNSGGFFACRKDIDCTPCFESGYCPGDRVCVNLGQDDDTLSDYRCVPSCTDDTSCTGEAVETCTTGKDGYGQDVQGCFAMGDTFPVNYCTAGPTP